jgi:ribosomal protein L11 methyltransferase
MTHTHWHARFAETDPARIDLLTGLLTLSGFDGFQSDDQGLDAYVRTESSDMEEILSEIRRQGFEPVSLTPVEDRNWNEVWESSFQPVVIPGKVSVRANFHAPVDDPGIPIVITPKMSFGTGHHATTVLMMEELFECDLRGKSVLDFGTGTGILAILAEKLGATRILAIDNDDWSIANTDENTAGNGCTRIETRLAETTPTDETFDIVLANINRNVILDHADLLPGILGPGGRLILSGLLAEDLEAIRTAFSGAPLSEISHAVRNKWLRITYSKSE